MQDEMKELQKRMSRFSISVCLFLVARRTRGLITYIWSYLDKPFLEKYIEADRAWTVEVFSAEVVPWG